jgi:2,4-dienoyl-CoA reductase-like NADH-dependent reductase (Old Yellow Enzyme family)
MPGLLDPIAIQGLTLKNRIVMAPMATYHADEDGAVTDSHIGHYAARARAGVGLIITEHAFIDRGGRAAERQLGIHDDRLIAGLKRLTAAIQAGGAASCVQITHAGARTTQAAAGLQPIAPSAVEDPKSGETPRALAAAEIPALAVAYARAARRAVEAGFDAVELHGAHGYLLGQFLSPLTNRRRDCYGGDLNSRLTFAREVIAAVRQTVGPGFPLFYRLGADDLTPGGLTPADGCEAARLIAAAGIDVIDVSGGYGGTGRDRFTEQGFFVPLAEAVRKAVGLPVIGVGNIHDPRYADRVIREGRIDLAAVGRALLADPLWARQAAREFRGTEA